MLKVFVDSSPESKAVVEALKRKKVKFEVLLGCQEPLPTFRTRLATLEGFDNICHYLLPEAYGILQELKAQTQPAQ